MKKPEPRPVSSLMDLDRIIHEPARLAILTILGAAEEVEFKFLEAATGLTRGNLSSHVAKLEAAGYLKVNKAFRKKIPVTSFQITEKGARALDKYRGNLFTTLVPPDEKRWRF